MKKKLIMDRRTCLKGIGGAFFALPLLECMLDINGVALAATGESLPIYSAMTFGGMATGKDNGQCLPGERDNLVYPNPGSILNIAGIPVLERALGARGITNDIIAVSGLNTPTTGIESYHFDAVYPILCGQNRSGATSAEHLLYERMLGKKGKLLLFDVSLFGSYSGSNGQQWHSSFKSGNNVNLTRKLRDAYNEIFGGFTPPDPGGTSGGSTTPDNTMALRQLDNKKSYIDLFLNQINDLKRRSLSSYDKHIIDDHLDSIRQVETSIVALIEESKNSTGGETPPVTGGTCTVPSAPTEYAKTGTNYSNEHERAKVLVQLIALAFACDISRVAYLQICPPKTRLDPRPWGASEQGTGAHGLTHGDGGSSLKNLEDFLAWDLGVFGDLVSRVKEQGILQQSLLSFTFEGGFGIGATNTSKSRYSHSMSEQIGFFAGGAGGKLINGGTHLRVNKRHAAEISTAHFYAHNLTNTQLGKVSTTIPGLFK